MTVCIISPALVGTVRENAIAENYVVLGPAVDDIVPDRIRRQRQVEFIGEIAVAGKGRRRACIVNLIQDSLRRGTGTTCRQPNANRMYVGAVLPIDQSSEILSLIYCLQDACIRLAIGKEIDQILYAGRLMCSNCILQYGVTHG